MISHLFKSRLRYLKGNYRETADWIIVEQGKNPSSDYYVKPEISRHQGSIVCINTESRAFEAMSGKNIVVVRYLSLEVARHIAKNKANLGKIVYFFDDDLFDQSSWIGFKADYRKKLRHNYKIFLHWQEIFDEFWVSTEHLAGKYRQFDPHLVEPCQITTDTREPNSSGSSEVKIFYHATGSHVAEFEWLFPVLRQTVQTHPNVVLELIGDHNINRLYRELPRTRILHPMSWPNYLDHTQRMLPGLGLAPLLPNVFNFARSGVKYFDIRRSSSKGIFSKNTIYEKYVQNDEAGWLVENDPAAWLKTIDEWVKTSEN